MTASLAHIVHDPVLDRLEAVVGSERFYRTEEGVDSFGDPFWPSDDTTRRAGAVVEPETVEEVQAIVRIAAESGTPVWTFSQGRNNAYGGPGAVVGGSVLLSLRRMNKILDVDPERATALVEPGVRFFDMYDHLREQGLPLWSSAPDLGWGSIVGNALDHGVGYTVHGDHASRMCGLEVVLPDGELLRTGMGAMGRSGAWQAHPRAYGPSADGLFTQSSLGVVTKMGIWLMPEPECYLSGTIAVPRKEDLEPLIDAIRPLMLNGTIQNQPAIGHTLFVASIIDGAPSRAEVYDGPGPVPEEVVLPLAEQLGIGRWNMRFALYGPQGVVRAKMRRVREAVAHIAGVRVAGEEFAGSEVHEKAKDQNAQVQAGIPSLDLMKALDWYSGPGGGHLDFSVVTPLRGASATEVHAMMDREMAGTGIDWDPAMILSGRCMINVAQLYFHPEDNEKARRVFALAPGLVRSARELGYGVYRTHVALMDAAAAAYDFNDHAQLRLNERLKDALDPAGVLHPGKQGVWPARYRDALAGA
ncbi:FAD-dependent oxidoreductase [Nocardioides sp. GY 10127]|uniref:FAD-dependent oxidoreductase n=1 Tax=Nocardioides sp. GY 10127 TaxID=2569762 RepID=UPI0014585D0F|nr:FAD-dependent oxidoreductase [Nocardioides sp. GY 10127]